MWLSARFSTQDDPKIAMGPITLALTDIFTLTFYYNIGRWLLG